MTTLALESIGVGAAWVFTRSGSVWTQQGNKLVAADEMGDAGFGNAVALSVDGSTALIGGPSDNNNVGAAWVFTRTGNSWVQQGAKLVGTGAIGGEFPTLIRRCDSRGLRRARRRWKHRDGGWSI